QTCIYDLNKNGYPEIVESGDSADASRIVTRTVLWEIEGVRLHRPNGGEILTPGSQFPICWEKFTPPGADSFSLFVSFDNGRNYSAIASLQHSTDTLFLWSVPDTVADSCKMMIWAYGPPRPGQSVPRGTAWDFSDSVFAIRQTDVKEEARSKKLETTLRIMQNPTTKAQGVRLLSISHTPQARLQIYDVVGSLVRSFTMTNNQSPITLLWNVCDDHGASLPEGVYFVRLESAGSVITRKVVVLE
ncbi:T9SS type A sorting domain-containing protein, partial [Candidatus Bathyarchaeota archaeon]|nr:T9SS type A sorting domain-containing protein [Candidatus Bathyarchaeota archaeon]